MLAFKRRRLSKNKCIYFTIITMLEDNETKHDEIVEKNSSF